MTKAQALQLITIYGEWLTRVGWEDPTSTQIMERWPQDGSENKAMRWLGFMQGVLYQSCLMSLDEIKQHSMHASRDDWDAVRAMLDETVEVT